MLVLFFGAGIFFLSYIAGRPIPLTRIKEFVRVFSYLSPTHMIHIGELIREELRRQERSVAWFARKLYCDRTNAYNIFRRSSIDTETLLRISRILDHDFFIHYRHELNDEQQPAPRPPLKTDDESV